MKSSYEIKADLERGIFQYKQFYHDKIVAEGELTLDKLPLYTEFLAKMGSMGTIEF